MSSCKSWHRLVHSFCSSEHDPAPKFQCPFDFWPLLAFSSDFEEEAQSADQNEIPILISPPFPSPLAHGSVSQQDGQHYLTAIFTAGHCTLLEIQKCQAQASEEARRNVWSPISWAKVQSTRLLHKNRCLSSWRETQLLNLAITSVLQLWGWHVSGTWPEYGTAGNL